jgi:hypothetical protein
MGWVRLAVLLVTAVLVGVILFGSQAHRAPLNLRDADCLGMPSAGHQHAYGCLVGRLCSLPQECLWPSGDADVCCGP